MIIRFMAKCQVCQRGKYQTSSRRGLL